MARQLAEAPAGCLGEPLQLQNQHWGHLLKPLPPLSARADGGHLDLLVPFLLSDGVIDGIAGLTSRLARLVFALGPPKS